MTTTTTTVPRHMGTGNLPGPGQWRNLTSGKKVILSICFFSGRFRQPSRFFLNSGRIKSWVNFPHSNDQEKMSSLAHIFYRMIKWLHLLFFFFFNESRCLNSHFPLGWSHEVSRDSRGQAVVCLSRDTCGIQTSCLLHSWCGTLLCEDLAFWLRNCSRGVRSLWEWWNILNLYLQSQTNSRKNTQNWLGDHSFSQLP